MLPLWYRNAVVYAVDPTMYRDSDSDGWGDLRGLTERLDYVRGLGATCLWILPFYASPFRDGGYDITDHLMVDPRFGDLADFVELLERAEELGIRVIIDLVFQHTSDQHRWFQEARHDRASPYRDYYVWADESHAVDVPIEQYDDYFSDGRGLTMLLNFWLNNHVFLALTRADNEPLVRALHEQPQPPRFAQYANWLRHHDELDLERLSDAERDQVMHAFAPHRSMRVYGRGIRRRLAPMLEGDERRIAMAHALLLSLPGTPFLYYGEEIGMGEELSRPERLAVRTPMQWSDDVNAGFSTAPFDQLAEPIITGGRYGYESVNVYAQTLRGDSLLAKVGNLIRTRLGLHEIGVGHTRALDVDRRTVLALRHDHQGSTVITLVNLCADDIEVTIPEDEGNGLVDVLADTGYPPLDTGTRTLDLRGYGYRWLRPREDLIR